MSINKQVSLASKANRKKSLKVISSFAAVVLAFSTIPFTVASAASKTEDENNNTRKLADVIYVNDTYTAKIGKLSDIDCFKFVPKVDDKIRVELKNIPSGKEYDLWLQDNNGEALTCNTAKGSSKYMTYDVTAETPYFIVVNSYESVPDNWSSTQSYMLSLKSINFSYISSNHYAGTGNIKIDTSTLSSPYSGYFTTAMNNWHSAISSVNFSADTSSRNKVYSDNYDDTWYGLHVPYVYTSDKSFSNFEIYINQRTLNNDSTPSNRVNYFQGTMAHELGHTLGLDDNPQTNATSLMKHNRNRNTTMGPLVFDVDAVSNNLGSVNLTGSISSYYGADLMSNTDYDDFDEELVLKLHPDYPEYENIETLYDEADLVAVCESTENRPTLLNVGFNDSEIPYTISNFKIKDVLKGDDSLNSIDVKQLGGTFGKVKYVSDDIEQFENNSTYLLFLKTYDDAPASLLNPVQGMYHIDGSDIISRSGNDIETNLSYLSMMGGISFNEKS